MNNYCGHISIEGGKITIDLGGNILPDGVYSIIQEAKVRTARKKCVINPDYKPYDKAEFERQVVEAIDGREISMPALAREMGIAQSTLVGRVTRDGLKHLFKMRKS